MSTSSTTARLDLRLDPQVKILIANASKAAGFRSMSDFVVQAALDKVDAMMARVEVLRLPAEAQLFLLEKLNDPDAYVASRRLLERKSNLNINTDEFKLT